VAVAVAVGVAVGVDVGVGVEVAVPQIWTSARMPRFGLSEVLLKVRRT
jgi:hypothetical protein